MLRRKETRHFHAGKQRKVVDGEEFVEVAESPKRFVSRAGHVIRVGSGGVVKVRPCDNGHGYTTISMPCYGKPSTKVYIHRLVYEVFAGQIPYGWDVDHINDVRNDNRLENLRIMTHYDNLTVKPSTVMNRYRASSRNIRKAAAAQERPVVCTDANGVEHWFKSSMAAARATGTNFTSISMAIHGYRVKKANGMTWRFAAQAEAK